MVNCDKHGLQDIVFTSPYIQKLILADERVQEEIFPVKMYIEVLDTHAYFWSNLQFINELGFSCETAPSALSLDNLGEEASFEAYAQTIPVCQACHAAFLQANNLQNPQAAFVAA
ncbi:hypothetical protein [Hymenobacter negativus]|nr:hypothetical protein [Hymenobacter negativus]